MKSVNWYFVSILFIFNTSLLAGERTHQSISSKHSLPALLKEDSEVAKVPSSIKDRPSYIKDLTSNKKPIGQPLIIGKLVRFDRPLNPQTTGKWQKLDNTRDVWRAQLILPGALWVDTQLKKLKLPPGTEIFITDAKDQVTWHYSAKEMKYKTELYTGAVPGESLRIEVVVPQKLRQQLFLEIGESTYGNYDRFMVSDRSPVESGACHLDVVCDVGPPSKLDVRRSVGLYSFRVGGFTAHCTGALIANKEKSHRPFFLTAEHCLRDQAAAASVVVYWNYQSNLCRTPGSQASGSPLPLNIATHVQSGARWRASFVPTDFTLLELNEQPPSGANTFYAGWAKILPSQYPLSKVFTIHHPLGHEKRISIADKPDVITLSDRGEDSGVGGDNFLRVDEWSSGTTETGSSGSPLFLNRGFIVGHLSGGHADCGNSEPDWYGSLLRSWHGGGTNQTQLRHWLAPDDCHPGGGGPCISTPQMAGYEGP